MIVLDDLHAADAPSLVLLRFISESIADAPVLIVGSYREREVRLNERRESFAELIRLATRISLQGLSVDDVEAYLAGVTGQEASRSARCAWPPSSAASSTCVCSSERAG
jgi:predicted ATPase